MTQPNISTDKTVCAECEAPFKPQEYPYTGTCPSCGTPYHWEVIVTDGKPAYLISWS